MQSLDVWQRFLVLAEFPDLVTEVIVQHLHVHHRHEHRANHDRYTHLGGTGGGGGQTPREVFCICLLRHLANSFSCSRAALRRTEYSPTTPSQSARAGAIASAVFTGAGR